MKANKSRAKLIEEEVKKRGKTEKPLLQSILEDVFKKYHVSPSKYHGGDIEGPSCRQLTYNGIKIFDDVDVYINAYFLRLNNEDDEIRPTSTEIDMVYTNYGRLLVMMDLRK